MSGVVRKQFSIIVPVFNAEDRLSKCIDSLVAQTVGLDCLEIVIVNDGSDDLSGEVCSKFAADYPDTVVYISQKNKGVSAARNVGLDCATGQYIGFVDADDWVSSTMLEKVREFFDNCSPDVLLATVPVYNVGKKTYPYYLNGKFSKGTRIVALSRPSWNDVVARVSPSFIRSEVAKAHRFDESVTYFEDTKYVTEILAESPFLGVVTGCKYYYRRGEEGCDNEGRSLTSSATLNPRFYTDTLNRVTLAMLKDAHCKHGFAPLYFEYVALCEMRWRFFYNPTDVASVLSDEERLEYLQVEREALSLISDKAILSFGPFSPWQKVYLLSIKHNTDVFAESSFDASGTLVWKGEPLYCAPGNLKINLLGLEVRDGTVVVKAYIEGYANSQVDVLARVNGDRVSVRPLNESLPITKYDLAYEAYAYKRTGFDVCINPGNDVDTLKFSYVICGREYQVSNIGISSMGQYESVKPTRQVMGGLIIRRFKSRITIVKATRRNVLRMNLGKIKKAVKGRVKKTKRSR